jgi:solute:Na+ symporter, SSS family
MLNNVNLSFVFGYLILALIIGFVSSKKQSGKDFMIADRNLGLFSFVSTVVASIIGGTILVVYTAYIFEFGLGALFGFVGLAIGLVLFAYWGKRLRELAHKENFYTIEDFLHYKFGRRIGSLVAIVVLISVVLILLKQFIAGAKILSAVSSFSYESALILSLGVIFIYLIMGGFRSVVKTDIFQYLLLVFLIFVVGFNLASGTDLNISNFSSGDMNVFLMISFLIYGIIYVWTSADTWQRVYAARDDKVVKRGLTISGLFLLVIGIGITLIGYSAKLAFPDIDPGQAIVYGLVNLLSPSLLGLGVVLMFSAIMSTADTFIFVVSTNITKDFIARFKRRELSSNELRKYTRINLVLILILIGGLAYFFRNLVDIALINAGLMMSLTPVVIGSFRWKLKKKASLISIVAGLIYVVVMVILRMITPEMMIAAALVSLVALLLGQKFCN